MLTDTARVDPVCAGPRSEAAWNKARMDMLQERFVGQESDFLRLAWYLRAVWTPADVRHFLLSPHRIAWDAAFQRERLVYSNCGDPEQGRDASLPMTARRA